MDTSKPEELLKMSKKGKTVMMFVRVNNFKERIIVYSLFKGFFTHHDDITSHQRNI